MLFLLWRYQTKVQWWVKELIKRMNLQQDPNSVSPWIPIKHWLRLFIFPEGGIRNLFLSPGIAKRHLLGGHSEKGDGSCKLQSFCLGSEALISSLLPEYEGRRGLGKQEEQWDLSAAVTQTRKPATHQQARIRSGVVFMSPLCPYNKEPKEKKKEKMLNDKNYLCQTNTIKDNLRIAHLCGR